MYKRLLCLMLSIAMVFASIPMAFAESKNDPAGETLDEIMDDYYHQLFEVQNVSAADSTRTASLQVQDVRSRAMSRLSAAGYEAYSVEPSTFNKVEKELNTDFEEVGMDPNCSYIVVIGGMEDGSSASARQAASGSFTYTYMGAVHTMRYVTVFPEDDSRYVQSKNYNCLSSESDVGIVNGAINAGVSFLLDLLNTTLRAGTIAGILGIDFNVLDVPQPISLILIGRVRWVRVYTQIYNQAFGRWETWSSVDHMKVSSRVILDEFDSSIDDFVTKLSGNWESEENYSSHYDDFEHRNQQAVLGMLNRSGRHEYVGGAYLYYGTVLALIFNQYKAVSPP